MKNEGALVATIKKVHPGGLVVMVECEEGFVPRRELSWENPNLDPLEAYSSGQQVNVVSYKSSEPGKLRFSAKRVYHNPWKQNSGMYTTSIREGRFRVAQGIVRSVTMSCVYVELTDHNDGILLWDGILPAESGGEDDSERSALDKDPDLTKWFCIGDHIEGRVKSLRMDQENLVLDVVGHAVQLAEERRKKCEEAQSGCWVTLGALYPQLASLGLAPATKTVRTSECISGLRVLAVENLEYEREMLRHILDACGCSYELPATAEEFYSVLNRPGYFDVVFLDKNLDTWTCDLKGDPLIERIREYHPGIPVAVFSMEDLEASRKAFRNAQDLEVFQKPYDKCMIENILKKTAEMVNISSLGTMRKMDQELRSFLLADEGLEESVTRVLRHLCQRRGKPVKAAVLRMDPVGNEVHCVASFGLEKMNWQAYKSTLRHTPIANVILDNEMTIWARIPETRKTHFPEQLDFASFAGLPIETFGEINHGLFLFGSTTDALGDDICRLAPNAAFTIARLLEKALLDRGLADEALFASMGRLYMTMGHEIRDAVIGVDEVPKKLRQHLGRLEAVIDDRERSSEIKAIHQGLNALEEAGRRILKLFYFYADLSRQDNLIASFHVKDLIEDIVGEMKKRHCSGKTIFDVHVDAFIKIEHSELKFRQVMKNLILNACQQMDAFCLGLPYIRIRASIDKELLKIAIQDSGPGIHTKDWERIFQPFQSTRKEGAGLGLYLCRLLVRSMRGTIRVQESFRLIGTTFLLELPLRATRDDNEK